MNWFKYNPIRDWDIRDAEAMDNRIRSVFNSTECGNCVSSFKYFRRKLSSYFFNNSNSAEWINYCGIFYFFIRSVKAKQKHYDDDIKPIFASWSRITIDPLEYHYGFESLFIKRVIDTMVNADPNNMGRDHLSGYKKLNNSSFVELEKSINNYNLKVKNLIDESISKLKLDISVHVPTIVEYDNITKLRNNYYVLHNIRSYLWTKFWEEKPKTNLSVIQEGGSYVLASSESPNRLATSDNEWDLQQLKEYLDGITNEYVNSVRTIESERKTIVSDFDNFKQVVQLIMRDLSWNRLLRGKCGWEKGFLSLR
jgi:hypothetical protein